MRKILTKIVTLFLITVLSVTAFAGCALITTDTDRDMAQVVSTVQIEDSITADNLHKIEMLSCLTDIPTFNNTVTPLKQPMK